MAMPTSALLNMGVIYPVADNNDFLPAAESF